MIKFSFKLNQSCKNQLLASFLCNLCVVVGGTCFSWLEPIVLYLTSNENEMKVTLNDISWMSAIIEIAAGTFGFLSGFLMEWWGRKIALITAAPIAIICWALVASTRNVIFLYVVRLIQGIIQGICHVVAPVYVAEISSPHIRGTLGGHFTGFIYLGFLYTYLMSYFLSYQNYIYSLLVLPVIFFITFIFMPESPYYYLMKKQNNEAMKSLTWLRGGEDVEEELSEIQKAVEEDMKNKGGIKDLFATKSDRRAFIIVALVTITSYTSGIYAINSYGTQTFAMTTLQGFTPEQLSVTMGAILCVTAFLFSSLTDIIGRRPLLIVSSIGVTISNVIISSYYFLYEMTAVDMTSMSWVMYIGLFGLCTFSNLGLCQLLPTVRAEFFPSNTRAVGSGLSSVIAALTIFIMLKIYQPIIDTFGVYMNFLIYAIGSFIGTVLIKIYVTESAGKTFSEINQLLKEVTSKE